MSDCLGGAACRAERFAATGDTEVLLEGLPNLETPFLVDEGYVHTDDDAPATTRVVDELAAVLVRLRAQEFYKVPPLRSDIETLERLYADLAVLAQ